VEQSNASKSNREQGISCSCHRIGIEKRNDETLLFNGRSSIYDYNGDTLAEAPVDSAKIITAEIYPERTRDKSFNLINDIILDRLPDMYKQIMKK
jgi:predicted amidohydrolase